MNRIACSHHIFKKEGFQGIIVSVYGKKKSSIGTEKTMLKDADLLHYEKDSKVGH